jgi:hypothetical protein
MANPIIIKVITDASQSVATGKELDKIFAGVETSIESMQEASNQPLFESQGGAELDDLIAKIKQLETQLASVESTGKKAGAGGGVGKGMFNELSKGVELFEGGTLGKGAGEFFQTFTREGISAESALGALTDVAGEAGKNLLEKFIPGLLSGATAQAAATTATTASTASTVGFGVALKFALGPIGLAVAAIGLVAIGFAAFAAGTKDLGEATADTKASLDEFNTASQDAADTTKQSKNLEDLATKYEQLSASTDPKSQAELQKVTKELAETVPGAVAGIDELDATQQRFRDSTIVSTDAVREFAEENRKLAETAKAESLEAAIEDVQALAESYREAKDEQADLRKDRDKLVKDGGDGSVGGFLGIGADDIGDVRKELGEVNKKLKEAEPEIRRAVAAFAEQGKTVEEIAEVTGLTKEEVLKFGGAIEVAKNKTKEWAFEAAKVGQAFDDAQANLQKSIAAGSSGVAAIDLAIAKARKTGTAELDGQILTLKQLQELHKKEFADLKAINKEYKAGEQALEKVEDALNPVAKQGEDAIANEEARQHIHQALLESKRLELDLGKLSAASQLEINRAQIAGLIAIDEEIKKKLGKKALEADLNKLGTEALSLRSKLADNQKQLVTLTFQELDAARELAAEFSKIELSTEHAFLNILKTLNTGNDTGSLDVLRKEIDLAGKDLLAVFQDIPNKLDAGPVLTQFAKIFDETGKIREGIDFVPLLEDAKNAALTLNEILAQTGKAPIDFTKVFTAVNALVAAQNTVNQTVTKQTQEQFRGSFDLITQFGQNAIEQQLLQMQLLGTSEEDILAKRLELYQAFNDEQIRLATEANDPETVKKLQEERTKIELDALNANLAQQRQTVKDFQESLQGVFQEGFSATVSFLDEKFFGHIDERLAKSNDGFEILTGTILRSGIKLLEQILTNIAAAELAALVSGAIMTTTMEGIAAAAAPAATLTSIATFGTAAAVGGASVLAALLATKGAITALESGSVIDRPTLTVLGEGFKREFVLPEETADDILREKLDRFSGADESSMERAFSKALAGNPRAMRLHGYEIVEVNQREEARRISRR